MIAPPLALLFPNARFLAAWVAVTIGLFFFALMPTPSGFPATNGGLLCTTAAAALWASDCLRRMRQWEASILVPGYAATAWAVAVGIVWCATALATTISSLAGNAAPAFGLAALGGTVVVVGLTFLHKRKTWGYAMIGAMVLAVAAVIADHRGMISWHLATLPASQSAALALAGVAAAGLGKRLGTPTRPNTDSAVPWRYFHPRVAGLRFFLGVGQPPARISEATMFAIPASLAMPAYAPFDSLGGLAAGAVGLVTFGASLTPWLLLNVAAAWLPAAWQLGFGDSRRDVGRLFASRVVATTLAAFGLVLAVWGIHVLLSGQTPSRPGLGIRFDQTLLLCASSLVAFTVACSSRPTRTTKRPSQIGPLALVCAAFVIVLFSAPTFGLLGRTILLAVVAASAAQAVYAGGRLVSRFDFLPTNED